MGEIGGSVQKKDPAKVLAVLVRNGNSHDAARMYCDLFCEYFEAQENIARNGAVCANPRTGAPVENPFLKVRNQARAALLKMRRVNAVGLWDGTADVDLKGPESRVQSPEPAKGERSGVSRPVKAGSGKKKPRTARKGTG